MANKMEIHVTGTSTLHRRAERGVMMVTVSALEAKRDTAAYKVTSTANKLQELLAPLNRRNEKGEPAESAAVTHWSMSTLSTSVVTRHNKDGDVIGRDYSCRTSFEVKFKQFAALGEFASDVLKLQHVDISRVEWRVTDATRDALGSQSRMMAVQDAVAKAADFARPITNNKPRATELRETSSTSPVFGSVGSHARGGGAGQGAANTEALSFAPEDVTLTAKVGMKFEVDI